MPNTPKVSASSTKKDILEAYQELLTAAQTQPSQPEHAARVKRAVPSIKQSFGDQIESLTQLLESASGELLEQFDQATELLKKTQETQSSLEYHFEEESQARKKVRQREEEEYSYDYQKRKQRLESELGDLKQETERKLNERKQQTERELSEREVTLNLAEDELKSLRTQVAQFDTHIAKEVKAAVERKTQELELHFKHEQQLSSQTASAEQALLKQQVASLQASVKAQNDEIKSLQSALKDATTQVTRIAERAVTHGQATTALNPQHQA